MAVGRSAVGVREGRGRDDLTDEIAIKKSEKAVVLPHKTMFPKGKGSPVPPTARREKNTMGEKHNTWRTSWIPAFLVVGLLCGFVCFMTGLFHSVFWDLYCAAPERRESCDHSSEAKAFHDYSAAAAPSPVMGGMPPGDGMPGGPMPPGFFQGPPGPQGSPHPQPPPPNSMMGPHSHPNLGPMQRMSGPRGMGPMGPGPQNFGGGMRPPHNSMGPGMPGVNMGPGTGRPWPNPNNSNSMPYSSPSPGAYGGASGDSNNSGDNLYTMINTGPGNRNNFPMGPGSDGPLGAMAGMEPHHMNGSLGSGDMDGMNKQSSWDPRDDGELSGNFLHSFQSENYSPTMTM
ncbi:hypothetical protein F7725_027456, partial [Dissostichus mawsoni]